VVLCRSVSAGCKVRSAACAGQISRSAETQESTLCGTYVEGAFASQAMQGFSVGSLPGRRDLSGRRSARLSGTEIDQRGYNHKGEGKDSCQAAKQMEIVSMEGLKFKKCVGDLVATEGRAFFVMEGSS
jgi:hypothetical protein